MSIKLQGRIYSRGDAEITLEEVIWESNFTPKTISTIVYDEDIKYLKKLGDNYSKRIRFMLHRCVEQLKGEIENGTENIQTQASDN